MAWPLIAMAAASILSGMMGNKAAKKQQQAQERLFNRVRGEAQDRLAPGNTQTLASQFYPGAFGSGTASDLTPTMVYHGGQAVGPYNPLRASGGPVKPNRPYLTGEKGPELLTSSTREKSKDRLGALQSAMLDETGAARRVPGEPGSNRLEGYPTAGFADRYSMGTGLGQPRTSGPSSVADFLSMIVQSMQANRSGSLPARAKGGPISKGKATVVGEKGPEIIVPKKAGTVIPHEASGLPDTGAAAAPGATPGPDALPMGAEAGGPALAGVGAPDADGDEGGGEMPLPGFGSNGGAPSDGAQDPLVQFVLEAVLEKLSTMMGGGGASPGGMMGGGADAPGGGMGAPPGAATGGGTMPPMPGGAALSGPPGPMGMGGPPPGLPARATGGPVAPGQPTLVGERGPEQLVQSGWQRVPQTAAGTAAAPGAAQLGGGATATQQQPLGGLVTGAARNYLENPGQLSSTTYERGQEAANRGEMSAQNSIRGLEGRGIDLASTGVGALQESAALSANKQRGESARDYGLMSETMRRSDIAQGTQVYQAILQQIFGIQQAQANAALGLAAPSMSYPTSYGAAATGLGVLSNYLANNSSGSAAGGGTTGGQPVNIGGSANM